MCRTRSAIPLVHAEGVRIFAAPEGGRPPEVLLTLSSKLDADDIALSVTYACDTSAARIADHLDSACTSVSSCHRRLHLDDSICHPLSSADRLACAHTVVVRGSDMRHECFMHSWRHMQDRGTRVYRRRPSILASSQAKYEWRNTFHISLSHYSVRELRVSCRA